MTPYPLWSFKHFLKIDHTRVMYLLQKYILILLFLLVSIPAAERHISILLTSNNYNIFFESFILFNATMWL
jgi:hypothetical protein